MKFRTALLVRLVLLVASILVATVGAVAMVLTHAARDAVAGELQRARFAFEELTAFRVSLYRSESRVIAEDPRLKAVVATEDISRETIVGVVLDLKKALQCDLFLLIDGQGRLLIDTGDSTAEGFDMGKDPLVAGALRHGELPGVWTNEGHAYEMHARRLAIGSEPVGVLVLGYELDDDVVRVVHQQTGSSIVVELDGQVVAASPLDDVTTERGTLAAALAAVPATTTGPVELTLGGFRFLAVSTPLRGYSGPAVLRYVVLRSLDRALAPAQSLIHVLYGIAAAALAIALFVAAEMSRGLSRPLDDLMTFIGRVAANHLHERSRVRGPIELVTLGNAMNQMVQELELARRELTAKERLEKELEIGARIQTSILPRSMSVQGLEIAARMLPASEVGGDYYDVIPVPGGCWIGVGDVSGHGLTSGLVMLMIQSVVAGLSRDNPNAAPREMIGVLNNVLYDNIRHRLAKDEHVTLTLLRFFRDGRLVFAGAHEELVVCRADTGRCETIPTPGTWLGARPDVRTVTVDSCCTLHDGDLMVLYTDGVTEAMDASRRQFGMERLCAEIEKHREQPVEHILAELMAAVSRWQHRREDDVTVIVLRYSAPEATPDPHAAA